MLQILSGNIHWLQAVRIVTADIRRKRSIVIQNRPEEIDSFGLCYYPRIPKNNEAMTSERITTPTNRRTLRSILTPVDFLLLVAI